MRARGVMKCDMAYMVGGDFDAQLNVGNRGQLSDDLLHLFDLKTANQGTELNNPDHLWILCNSLGVKGQIDSIFHSHKVDAANYATKCLDLGSDHRAVFARALGPTFSKNSGSEAEWFQQQWLDAIVAPNKGGENYESPNGPMGISSPFPIKPMWQTPKPKKNSRKQLANACPLPCCHRSFHPLAV